MKLLKISSNKKFKIFVASRSDFLKGLGASVEIIKYIESLEEYSAHFLTNVFRKYSLLTLSELPLAEIP